MEEIAQMQEPEERDELPLEYVDMRYIGAGQTSGVMSALQFQHKLFLREMNGALLPEAIVLEKVETVMDLICGPGGWCLDFSRQHPEVMVYGVDINRGIIEHAREDAAHAHAANLQFVATDRTRPLPFSAHTFDIVHVQNGTSLYTMEQWPEVMEEITRVLKPGGWLNLVDFEMGPASQPAIDRVLTFLGQLLATIHRSSEPGGRAPFTGSTLGPQRMTGFHYTDIGYKLYPVDLGGWNNPVGRAYLAWSVMRPEMIYYLAERTGLGTRAALQPLLREVQRELRAIDFCGFGMLLSAYGRKPVT
jgi:SAM-dependent methyltransferase